MVLTHDPAEAGEGVGLQLPGLAVRHADWSVLRWWACTTCWPSCLEWLW
jgi:hypothetical protein